jgi:cell wall-associated protease
MAAPVVSGVAALLMAYYPELTAEEVRQIIVDSATRFVDNQVLVPGGDGRRIRFGDLSRTGGVVNVFAAVQTAEQMRAAAAR